MGRRNISISEGKANCRGCAGRRERGHPPVSPGPSRELMLHFSLAATGGQPEGGSRPQSSPKNGAGGIRGSSRSGAGAVEQRGAALAAGESSAGDVQAEIVQCSTRERNFMSVR